MPAKTLAMQSLDRIEAALSIGARARRIMPLRITVRDLKTSFDSLVNEQKSLGYNETEGVTADLIAASNAVENIIHDDLSWVADEDRNKMLMSLLTMRRYEIEYRLTRDNTARAALPRRRSRISTRCSSRSMARRR